MRYPVIGTLFAACIIAAHPLAQSQAPKPAFEVASVKKRDSPLMLTGPNAFVNPNVLQGGTFRMPSATVSDLIQFAYNVKDYLMVGGPDWIRKDLFETIAKAGSEASQEQTRLMVQSLLEERFRLIVRTEQREVSQFVMTVARADGQLGPNIQARECRSPDRPKRPPMPSGALMSSGCGTMSVLAGLASRYMGAPVVDKTGVSGTFDYVMYLSPAEGKAVGINRSADAPPPDPGLPSFDEALRSQLGFKLERIRGPLEMLVIDSVQQPTEN